MYKNLSPKKRCSICRFVRYDSYDNQLWCSHEPSPEGLGYIKQVDHNGICEYFEKELEFTDLKNDKIY